MGKQLEKVFFHNLKLEVSIFLRACITMKASRPYFFILFFFFFPLEWKTLCNVGEPTVVNTVCRQINLDLISETRKLRLRL